MKRWKSLTAALCAAVLLCGFSAVPAFAYADGGEGENYGDPTMTEETTAPEPEPTIEPGEGFSEEGNLVTRDLLYDEHTNKQFITVQTAGGNTFYIVIDYDKPVDEEGEQYETYFLSMTDEADLMAAAEAAGVEQAACSCSEKCAAGAVNTDCPVCSLKIAECVGVEPEPEPDPPTVMEAARLMWPLAQCEAVTSEKMVRVVYMGTLDCCRSSPTSMVQNWARVSTSLGRKVPSL